MFKIIGGILVAVVVIFLIVAALQPDEFHVQRSLAIQAPPEKIYPLIADFKRWRDWSAYETKDPAMQRTYSGPDSGVGAHYGWSGDKNVGKGNMTIASVTAPTAIAIDLHFEEPFEARNTAQFDLARSGSTTTVTWSMRGHCPFMGKVMGLIFDMDKMVGTDFEVGLARLKTLAEK